MDPIEVAIVLLTVVVVILSVITLVLLALVVTILMKLRKLADRAELVTQNLVSATAWLSPTTVFSAAARAFRKK